MPSPRRKPDRALQDGQRRQAEEVEFHQPRLLDVLHRVLRDQEVGSRIAIQRHQLDQRPVADHHAGGMGAGVAIQALDLQRDLQQPRGCPRPRRASAAAAARRRSPAASVTGLAGLFGISSATLLTWPNGRPSTRPTSRTAARACSLPKVMICATRSRAVFAAHIVDHRVAAGPGRNRCRSPASTRARD